MSYTRLIDDEKLSHLLQEYPCTNTDVLAKKYNLSETQIRGLAGQFGVTKGRGYGQKTPIDLNPEQLKKIFELYPSTPTCYLEKEFGMSRVQITHLANSRGIKKNPGYTRVRNVYKRNEVCEDLFRMYPLYPNASQVEVVEDETVPLANEETQADITITYKGRTITVNEDERGKSVLEIIFNHLM